MKGSKGVLEGLKNKKVEKEKATSEKKLRSYYLDDETEKLLKAISLLKGESLSQIVMNAIWEYGNEEEIQLSKKL